MHAVRTASSVPAYRTDRLVRRVQSRGSVVPTCQLQVIHIIYSHLIITSYHYIVSEVVQLPMKNLSGVPRVATTFNTVQLFTHRKNPKIPKVQRRPRKSCDQSSVAIWFCNNAWFQLSAPGPKPKVAATKCVDPNKATVVFTLDNQQGLALYSSPCFRDDVQPPA